MVISTSTALAWAYLAVLRERLADNGPDISDQVGLNHGVERTVETYSRSEAQRRDCLLDHLENGTPNGRFPGDIAQLEDRHPDLLDRLVEILDAPEEPRVHFGVGTMDAAARMKRPVAKRR